MGFEIIKDRKLWGIFFLAMGTLLYEVVLTSIFSYTVWSNYAFMIVSTALFGFGVAGVFLYIFQRLNTAENRGRRVSVFSFCFAVTAIFSLLMIIWVPLDVSRFDKLRTWVYLAIIFISIMAPFFFAGLSISILLSSSKKEVNRLYFFDLVGASIGSLVIILLITPLGATGTLLFSALLGVVASIVFLEGRLLAPMKVFFALVFIGILVLIPVSEKIFKIYPHQNKRNFTRLVKSQTVFFSGWSPLSKIDVIGRKVGDNIRAQIWINGGQNQSFLAVLGPNEGAIKRPNWGESINFPYIFMRHKKPRVMIIGSSGGTEVVYALSHRSSLVDAVEMDPLICKIVRDNFRQYNRNLFRRKDVHLHNDEGRSFVINTDDKYDLIQMKNNFTPIAIASGSIDLSEPYLLTVAGFKDYIKHLTPDGFLALNRWGSVRLCTTLRKAFEELGRKDVWKHVAILTGETWMLNGFYYKNSPFSEKEVGWIKEYAKVKHFKVLYHPHMTKEENLYAKILKGDNPEAYYRFAGFELSPPTDDKPFFNHFLKMGSLIDIKNPLMVSELKWVYKLFAKKTGKTGGRVITKSDLPVFSLAIESIVMSFFFIFIPLLWVGKRETNEYKKWPFLYYFTILGMGFIMIELCLMKQFVLFLGYPAISISLIIAILLFFTGVGSFIAERFQQRIKSSLKIVFPLIFLVSMGLMLLIPKVFPIFLGSPFAVKAIITVLLLFPLGIVMGMPFPLGLVLVHERSKNLVGWVWGINGFATVVGSVLTVLMALYWGFSAVLVFASILYLSALLVLKEM